MPAMWRFLLLVAVMTNLALAAPKRQPRSTSTKPKVEEQAKEEKAEKEKSFPRWHFDLGASAGSSYGRSFYEINLGVKYNFTPWLGWRNAPFYRFVSGADAQFGLDSSLRGNYTLDLGDSVSLGTLVGGGFRLANQRGSAPFVEGGVQFNLSGLRAGLGLKYLMGSVMDSTRENELIYSITLAGGTSF